MLVEPYGGIQHSGVIGGVDLERGEMCSDAAPCVDREEMRGDRYGERCALFGVGRGAKLVEEDE